MNKNFEIISIYEISKNRQIVMSRNDNGEYVLAKRAVIDDNGKERYYYEKGSIIFKDLEGFKKFLYYITEDISQKK